MLFAHFILLTYISQCFSKDRRIITSLKYSSHKLTVVNGEPADVWEVPYLASLKEPLRKLKDNKKLWGNLCGASIISSNGRLLTAAHCFEDNKFLYAKRPYILRAVTGSLDTDIVSLGISGISKSGVQWRQVQKAVLHKDFNFPFNDIAIVFVDYPWDYKRGVKPIALPLEVTTTDRLLNCRTAGYGRTGHGAKDKTSQILMTAHIDIMPAYTCSLLWQISMDQFICSKSVATDVSEGDSGGPLLCYGGRGPVLAGIVSGKSFDKSTIYTRVSYYLDWINRNGSRVIFLNNNSSNLFCYDMFWLKLLIPLWVLLVFM